MAQIDKDNELRDYRIQQNEFAIKELATKVTGLELWKAKVEDIIKGKAPLDPVASKASDKDWVKIIIMVLTIISGLVALLAQVIK